MKKEYDFSAGERGRFFHPEAAWNIPVYLDQDVDLWFAEKAKPQGIELQALVNKMLRKDISLIQEVTGSLRGRYCDRAQSEFSAPALIRLSAAGHASSGFYR